ncbi:MAG: hypothetical protein K2H97_01090 [Prevotella sp.]|nr:hypothetical protein [Prevotella sp.]
MKKRLHYLAMLLMSLSIGFVSCGSDDDDSIGGGSASATTGVLDGLNKRVKSIGDYTFYYKDNGMLDYITEGRGRYEFTYNPNKIVYIYDGKEKDMDIVVTYNGLGYVARVDMTNVFINDEDEGYGTGQETISCAYDNQGHLTSIKGSKKESYKGYEYNYTLKDTYSVLLTWENNLLLSTVGDGRLESGGDRGRYRWTSTYSYDNALIDDYHNKHQQYVPSVLQFLNNGDVLDCFVDKGPLVALAYAGLMGKGSLYLPVSSVDTDEEYFEGEEDYNRSYTHNFRYGFNSDGSIANTSINGSRYNFGYEYLNSVDRAAVATW